MNINCYIVTFLANHDKMFCAQIHNVLVCDDGELHFLFTAENGRKS